MVWEGLFTEHTRKKFTFQSGCGRGGGGKGIEEERAAANPKGHPLIQSLRLEGALPQNNFYLGRGLDCSRRSQRTDGSWNRLQLGPGSPSLRSVTGSHARPLNLNVCNRLFMIKTTDQHCHNFIYYIFHEFFSWYSKIWTTTHPLELICSPLLLLAYTRFSVWSRLLFPEKNNDFCFMSSLLHLNRRDFTKVPRYVCSACRSQFD